MFRSRIMNNKINRIHERALSLVYSDHISSFDELLKKDRSFCIHHRNIQSLAIELYKFLHGLSPSSFYQVTTMEQLDTLIFDAIIKLLLHCK